MRIDRHAGPGPFTSWVVGNEHHEVHVIPERGGLITRWRVGGEELLYLDEATLLDRTKNVRGGIPLLFPNPGPLPDGRAVIDGQTVTQPQHGFARLLPWEVVNAIADEDTGRLELRLDASESSRAGFPWDFRSTLAISVYGSNLLMEWTFENRSPSRLPLHAGLHPYFRVETGDKARAHVPTPASRLKERRTGEVRPAGPLRFDDGELDVALLDHGRASAILERGDGSRVVLSYTSQLETLVLWTLPNQPFICVEPWTAPAGALATGEGLRWLEPGASELLAVECRLER